MKKIFYVLFLFLFVACQKDCEKVKNDWLNDELKGRVVSYRIINYLAALDLGEIFPSDVIGAEGKIVYNEKGYRIEEFWRFNEETSRKEYCYDNNDNCVELISFKPNNEIEERGIFVYDKNGVLMEELYYNANNNLFSRLEYTFDENGNLIQLSEYDPNGVLEESQKSKFKDGLEQERYTYYYDVHNVLITKYEYRYNKHGKLIEGILFDDAKNLLGRWVYTYDEQQNLISEESFDSEGILVEKRTYDYKYDEKNNWTERVTYDGEENEPRVITKRQFEYFD